MAIKSGIEWTDATWNPTRGCSRVSPGCVNCYAERVAMRQIHSGYKGLVHIANGHPAWTGVVRAMTGKTLEAPLRWRKPRRIFVNSMSDLFHESLPDEAIDRVFAVMALSQRHTFQILTKRADRMLAYFTDNPLLGRERLLRILNVAIVSGKLDGALVARTVGMNPPRPLPNVWLGVSVENQKYADERIPLLLQTPAAIRFVSYEPAIGPVDFARYLFPRCMNCDVLLRPAPNGREIGMEADLPCGCKYCWHCADNRGRHEQHDDAPPHGSEVLDWIISGFESGPGARQAEEEWMRSTKDQCVAAGTAFFYKQKAINGRKIPTPELDGQKWMQFPKVAA